MKLASEHSAALSQVAAGEEERPGEKAHEREKKTEGETDLEKRLERHDEWG